MGRRENGVAETVAGLERRIGELEQELKRRAPTLPAAGEPGWDDTARAGVERAAAPAVHTWLSIIDPPVRRRTRLPRLPFEVLFLAGCAVAAGIADLEPLWIAAVMGAAWLLVSLVEWAATYADRRRDEQRALPPPRLVTLERPDQSWYAPPVEQTMSQGPHATSATAITRLRRRGDADLETTIGDRPAESAETAAATAETKTEPAETTV
ncbi:MAG: hypothetical protein FJW96_06570 [Actinobacteria bacterium]|nr:hypothetical protein [Actinomycetota bacterium]